MTQQTGKGCIMLFVGLFAVLILGSTLVTILFNPATMRQEPSVASHTPTEVVQLEDMVRVEQERSREEPEPKEPEDPRLVVITTKELDAYKRRAKGARLEIAEFVAARTESQSTSLVKSIFKENAEGAPVRWEVMTRDVTKVRDQIRGQFSVNYSYRKEDGEERISGTVSVHCEFKDTTANELLDLQRGDWVVLEGKYSMATTWPTIMEAKLLREEPE